MKIAAIYARVSSTKQQLNENISSQIAAIEQYGHEHDYHISPQHIYIKMTATAAPVWIGRAGSLT